MFTSMFTGRSALAAILAGMCALTGAATATAEIYKYVDEQGNVHFQDHPPQAADKARNLEVRKSLPSPPKTAAPAPSAAPANPGRSAEAAAAAEASRLPQEVIDVELFGVSWCPWCRKAREFFRSRGVPYTYYDIEKDPVAAARKQQLSPGKGVPFALINGVKIKGYSAEEYTQALRRPLRLDP